MRRALVLAIVCASAGTASADEPTWRYGAAFGFGESWIDGDGYSELDLTLQASRRVAPAWRLAGHVSKLALSDDDPVVAGDGVRLGAGLERRFAGWTEPGGAAGITGYVRGGLTREAIYWDRGRLDRDGGYLEVRGIVDFDLSYGAGRPRLFGMGLAVRAYLTRTPALLATGPVAAAAGTPRSDRYDLGFVVAWEWTASR